MLKASWKTQLTDIIINIDFLVLFNLKQEQFFLQLNFL